LVKSSTLAVILAALIISVALTAEADGAGLVKRAISTVGTWAVSDIPNLPASKITSGTFSKTMIASSGTFPWSEISKTGSRLEDLSNVTSTGCAVGQILKVSGTTWQCAADSGLTAAVTSINADTTAAQTILAVTGNTTVSTTSGATTINLGTDVVTTGGSAQTITKALTFTPKTIHSGGINIPALTDITTNGDFWLNSSNVLKYRANSVTRTVESSLDVGTSFTPANATGTTSTTFVMMGYGSTVSVTPASTGRLLIIACASTNANANPGFAYTQIQYGTGAAPSNGAAVTGTSAGPIIIFSGNNAGQRFTSCSTAVVSGLQIGTAYWIDLALRSNGAYAVTQYNPAISVEEI